MMLFRNNYRIKSARLPRWDYSSPGYYFITVCAAERSCLFGTIDNGTMILNTNGEIVLQEWEKSFRIRQEMVSDAYCVMPNHFHAIVRIVRENRKNNPSQYHHVVCRGARPHVCRDARPCVSTLDNKLKSNTGVAFRTPKSISSLFAGFKSVVTKRINAIRETPRKPVWQPRFYDHIIRNDQELYAIRRYIENNPRKWEHDRNHPDVTNEEIGTLPWVVYM